MDETGSSTSTSSSTTTEDVVSVNSKQSDSHQNKPVVPESLSMSFQKALVLEENSRKEELKSKLRIARRMASLRKRSNHPSDWKYHPLTARQCVPNKSPAPIPAFPKKNKHKNPHLKSAPLRNRKAWWEFKALDEAAKITTLIGLPIPIREELKNPLEKDSDLVLWIRDFAVDAFNNSYQMYVNNNNNKNVRKAKIMDCYYLKFEDRYRFYLTIEAVEQKNRGFYDIAVSCKFDDGDITLDLFSLQNGYSSGTREAAILCKKATYETVADGWAEPELCYNTCGMVRRRWGSGYDYRNPYGFHRWFSG